MADLASTLEGLKQNRSTGCLQVESPTMGTWRLYLLFGKVFNASGPSGDGDKAVAQALACKDATSRFDARVRLPEEQNLTKVPGTDEPLEPDTSPQRVAYTHRSLLVRSCLVIGLLLFIIGPAAGIAFAVWLAVTPTATEAEAAKAYTSAPACQATQIVKDCVRTESAQLVSFEWFPGKLGSRTDRLKFKLADGVHHTDIYFSSTRESLIPPSVNYGPVGGSVRVREFRGQVTTVFDADGKGYETVDSPIRGASWRGGVFALLIILLVPVLIVASYLLIRGFGLRSLWRMLRNPTRPLPTYPGG